MDTDNAPESTGTEVERIGRLSDDDLRTVQTLSDAFGMLGVTVEDYSESYGSGFTVLDSDEKIRLVGVPFGILEWRFNMGDQGEFVSCVVMTEEGAKYVINDGSTGIYEQLRKVTDSRVERGADEYQSTHGLLVKRGLRKSDYDTDETGKPLAKDADRKLAKGRGTTYYLAN